MEAETQHNRRIRFIKQLVNSSDRSNDMHVFRRAIQSLNNFTGGNAFRIKEDIEACHELLTAVLRIIYELGRSTMRSIR